jgi:hypothetical protein
MKLTNNLVRNVTFSLQWHRQSCLCAQQFRARSFAFALDSVAASFSAFELAFAVAFDFLAAAWILGGRL